MCECVLVIFVIILVSGSIRKRMHFIYTYMQCEREVMTIGKICKTDYVKYLPLTIIIRKKIIVINSCDNLQQEVEQ